MFCTSPMTVYRVGMKPNMNPATGLPEWPQVACGKCKTCVAGRKNDWAGRLTAEAKASADVYFVTLTYAEEPDDFRYADVQAFMKRLRVDLDRNFGGAKVRFFCVGERGNRFGRIHWHLLLFVDQRLGWSNWNKHNHRKELWPYWPHGWTDLAKVPTHDTVRRVRYCSKYAVKSLGDEDKSCRFRCSLKPAIGWAYLSRWVDDLVDAGLPLKGWFTLPGMEFDRGMRKGELQRFRLRGASARNAARLYAELWLERRPNKVWPQTPFFTRYFREELMWRLEQWPETRQGMDWDLDPAVPREFRAVNPLRLALERDMERFDLEYQQAAQEAEHKALERSDDFGAYHREWHRVRWSERLREARASQAARAGYCPGDPEGDRFIAGYGFPESGSEKAVRLSEIRWSEGDGVSRRDIPGHPIRELQAQEARAEGDRQARACRAAGFEPRETFDPETGEIGFEPGEPIRRGSPEPRGQCDSISWSPEAGGLVERAFAAAGSATRGFQEARRGKAS